MLVTDDGGAGHLLHGDGVVADSLGLAAHALSEVSIALERIRDLGFDRLGYFKVRSSTFSLLLLAN